MASEDGSMKLLLAASLALVSLAAGVVMGIAVIGGFKDTNLVDNDVADNFITGLGVFGLFAGILALAVIGGVVVKFFRQGF